jgi:uncharacterized protein (TIGR02271 family)
MDNPTTQNALVAIFSDRATANSAVQQLIRNGFQSDQVEISSTEDIARQAAAGNAGLSGVQHDDSSGGGIAGFFRRLFSSDDKEDDRTYYSNAVRRGQAAVMVRADEDSLDRAADILNQSGAIEVEDREDVGARADYRQTPGIDQGPHARSGADETSSIPVVEQELQVGKRAVKRGAVRVYSRMMQQPVEERIDLREERVTVDRRAANRPATEADLEAADLDVIEITETVEEPIIGKRSRVVEEVVIGKEVHDRTETVRDNVLRSEVHVEDSRGQGRSDAGTTDFDADFQNDFRSRYGADPSQRYEDYAPAYRYGYVMASDPRYNDRSFDEMDEQLRTDYLRNNPNSAWDRIKGAVRYGWEKVTGKR